MERLGYIKDLKGSVDRLGGKIDSIHLLTSCVNPLNPTACYVITPPDDCVNSNKNGNLVDEYFSYYSAPASDFILRKMDGFLFSQELGLVYPVLKGIPILKENFAILATALQDNE